MTTKALSKSLKQRTAETRLVINTLKKAFPRAEVDAYRFTIGSIRVRVIDSQFRGKSWFERHDRVSPTLEQLPESTQSHIIVLILLTPAEHRNRISSHDYDFDHPVPFEQ